MTESQLKILEHLRTKTLDLCQVADTEGMSIRDVMELQMCGYVTLNRTWWGDIQSTGKWELEQRVAELKQEIDALRADRERLEAMLLV